MPRIEKEIGGFFYRYSKVGSRDFPAFVGSDRGFFVLSNKIVHEYEKSYLSNDG